eukprot:6001747-Heterocapsa_arctica.AAC.1
MEGSKIMEHDLAHFNRQDEGHPDRSYEYLLKVMDKNICIQQQAANREANSKAVRSGHLGLKGGPAINSEGLSKTAKKKAARAAELALAAASPSCAAAPGKGAGKGKGKPDAAASGE